MSLPTRMFIPLGLCLRMVAAVSMQESLEGSLAAMCFSGAEHLVTSK